jgi:hypothetical protein
MASASFLQHRTDLGMNFDLVLFTGLLVDGHFFELVSLVDIRKAHQHW